MLAGVVISNQQELDDLYRDRFPNQSFSLNVPNSIREATKIFSFIVFYKELFRIFSRANATHILVPMHHPWMAITLALLPSRIHVISIIHDAIPHEGDNKYFAKLFNLIICRYSWATLFLSEFQRKYQLTQAFCKNSKTGLIRHPSFRHYVEKFSGREVEETESFDFVFFGRLEPYKGLNLLIDAFKVVRLMKSNATLLIAGRPGKDFIRVGIESPGVQIDARYIPDDEVPAVIQRGRVVVLPYLTATQSGVMTVASDFGRVCVSTPLSGLKEQAEYTGHVYFADQLTPVSLAKAMTSAFNAPVIKAKVIESGINDYLTMNI